MSLNVSVSLEMGHVNESVSFRQRRHSSMKGMDSDRWGLLVKLEKYLTTSASHHVKHAMYAAVEEMR